MASDEQTPPYLKSKFPVSFPTHPALFYPLAEFEAFLKKGLVEHYSPDSSTIHTQLPVRTDAASASHPADAENPAPKAPSWAHIAQLDLQNPPATDTTNPFMKAIFSHDPKPTTKSKPSQLPENTMLTENSDIAYRSTENALVDLFFELEDVVSEDRLKDLLPAAWKVDALVTLKIIFNARSIHLGKSARHVFYRCLDWLSINHPLTCLQALQWLPRPVIEKKAEKKDDEDEAVFVEAEKADDDPTRFDVHNGVAHGYYKDLLNILVLVVNQKLNDPRAVLNVQKEKKEIVWNKDVAAGIRHDLRDQRHENAIRTFNYDPFYRVLHLMVARIFAEQLRTDLKLLRSGDKKALRQISLCAKWAPSSKLFHDRHTFIVSSIAEILHAQDEFKGVEDRTEYLRHAREAYRKDVSALRKQLEVVERDVSAGTFNNIKYERVPSLAMASHSMTFARKDGERFIAYLEDVGTGKKTISGATLLPSTLVQTVRSLQDRRTGLSWALSKDLSAKLCSPKRRRNAAVADSEAQTRLKVADSQWNTLVKRIKDSGTLKNSIAVCDISGSMTAPVFNDGTIPMDSSVGLSLLLAEVCEPPFGGAFITFHSTPSIAKVVLTQTFSEKVKHITGGFQGGSTNFTAVFEDLILPMAIKNNLKQEDMVKQIFVFSDMQFNEADPKDKFNTSYQRIQAKYSEAGYEMPDLIFWNLAGGRAGYFGGGPGDHTVPKPVTAGENGTALVSGYSQALLKIFLDDGSFDGADVEREEDVEIVEDGDEIAVVQKTKKPKLDPLSTVKKAVSHKAFDMFRVVD